MLAIADDYTGGSDLAGMFAERGVRTAQVFGVPDAGLATLVEEVEAVVVSLKSRSARVEDAVRWTLSSRDALAHCGPVYFKYCSTFDSTPTGNIGPVLEALLQRERAPFTVAVPALPVNGRRQYLGHLFVGGQLLSESSMRDHPLNPMRESNLVVHLQQQMRRKVGLIDLHQVRSGCMRDAMTRLQKYGVVCALVDAIEEADLAAIAAAVAELPLISGGSGLGRFLPQPRGGARLVSPPGEAGRTLILSGSCSAATLRQVEHLRASGAAILMMRPRDVDDVVRRAADVLASEELVAISSSAGPNQRLPAAEAALLEGAFGEVARCLVENRSATRVIVAGGETAGAVVQALGIRAVELTGILDPGVPALRSLSPPFTPLALKSGNFGRDDFFLHTVQFWSGHGKR